MEKNKIKVIRTFFENYKENGDANAIKTAREIVGDLNITHSNKKKEKCLVRISLKPKNTITHTWIVNSVFVNLLKNIVFSY